MSPAISSDGARARFEESIILIKGVSLERFISPSPHRSNACTFCQSRRDTDHSAGS